MKHVITGSKLWVINFYREQLSKFEKLGLGKFTENDVVVTPELIKITEKRLDELSTAFDRKITPNRYRSRTERLRLAMEKRNGQFNNNGTTAASIGKDNSDTGHEAGGS